MDHGSWIMDHGSWINDHGSRILDLGPCSGMNDHPGRDTDVISRPSKSTIKDLSFCIGFTRIQSSIKHLGPCFGMNGHFRRDPDVISRLPDTTTQDLSVFIGFRSQISSQQAFYTKVFVIYEFLSILFFCSGDHSRPFQLSNINFSISNLTIEILRN